MGDRTTEDQQEDQVGDQMGDQLEDQVEDQIGSPLHHPLGAGGSPPPRNGVTGAQLPRIGGGPGTILSILMVRVNLIIMAVLATILMMNHP